MLIDFEIEVDDLEELYKLVCKEPGMFTESLEKTIRSEYNDVFNKQLDDFIEGLLLDDVVFLLDVLESTAYSYKMINDISGDSFKFMQLIDALNDKMIPK